LVPSQYSDKQTSNYHNFENRYHLSFLVTIFKYLAILILPFLTLVRGSIYVHKHYDIGAYPSLFVGLALTTVLLFIYMTVIYSWLTKKLGDSDNIQRRFILALALSLGYCIYGIFFVSADNFKNPALKKEISNMHPILRLGVSTFILVDKKLIITDASRLPEDYRRMGLPSANSSLHYVQKDGYAYAIDLRTNNRNELRNQLMSLYFKVLGFNTLRHVGTADHLHISLHCHYRKGAR